MHNEHHLYVVGNNMIAKPASNSKQVYVSAHPLRFSLQQ
jgi:hypothetical protein